MSKKKDKIDIELSGDLTKIKKELEDIENAAKNAADEISGLLSAFYNGDRANAGESHSVSLISPELANNKYAFGRQHTPVLKKVENETDINIVQQETAAAQKTQKEKDAAEKKAQKEAEAAAKKALKEKEAAEKKARKEAEAAAKKAQKEKEAAEKKAQKEKEAAEKKARKEKEAAEKKARKEAEAAAKKAQKEAEAAAKKEQKEKEAAAKKAEQEAKELYSEQEKIVEKSLSNILKKFQDAYKELDRKRENYRKKLLSTGGDIFSVDEIEQPDGTKTKRYTVNNIDDQLKKMREYNAAVKKLKESGASDALLAELTSMSDEDSAQFAKYLSDLSAEELAKLNELYNEKQQLADELSKDLYAEDYAAVADGVNAALDQVSAGAADKGKAAAEAYAEAFKAGLLKHSEDFYELLGDAGYGRHFGGRNETFDKLADIGAMFTGMDISGMIDAVSAAVRTEQYRYSAAAHTAPVPGGNTGGTSSEGGKRTDLDEILKMLNKPVQLVLDGKTIAEYVMSYQSKSARRTGG